MDPVSVAMAASSAFTLLKKGIAAGKEIEDMGSTLAKWAGAFSDATYLEGKAKGKPPWYKTLAGSPEAEAIEIFAAAEKLRAQKKEIDTMIGFAYGQKGKERYLQTLRDVKERRKKHEHRKAEIREKIIEAITIFIAFLLLIAICGGIFYLVGVQTGRF